MNAEQLLVSWLNTALAADGVHASMSVPANQSSSTPAEFVTVERTGGEEGRLVSRPMFAVGAWAASTWRAAVLAYKVVDALADMPRLDRVAGVDIHSVADYPPDDGRARYQIACTITLGPDTRQTSPQHSNQHE